MRKKKCMQKTAFFMQRKQVPHSECVTSIAKAVRPAATRRKESAFDQSVNSHAVSSAISIMSRKES